LTISLFNSAFADSGNSRDAKSLEAVMDYRDLLKRYMAFVRFSEGVSFVQDIRPAMDKRQEATEGGLVLSPVIFTEAEIDELEKLHEESKSYR
jgi:hypothetical protein